MSISVEDVMITDVITIKPDYPVKYADSLMKYFSIGCLVVVDEGLPVGILTDNDIVRRVYMMKYDPHLLLVREVMSTPLIWVTPSTPLHEAAAIMMEKNVRRLPVIGNLSSGPVLLGLLSRVQVAQGEEEAKVKAKK
ncbi:MAG: CBS domain-containing protein [Candidatus Bathyarchaeota archaeon]